jgi:hypothetical protein
MSLPPKGAPASSSRAEPSRAPDDGALRSEAAAIARAANDGALSVPGADGAPVGALVTVASSRLDRAIVCAPRGALPRRARGEGKASVLVVHPDDGERRVTLVGALVEATADEVARARERGADAEGTVLAIRVDRALVDGPSPRWIAVGSR